MQKVDLVLRHYNKLKPINCKIISGDTKNLFTVEVIDNDSKGLEAIKGDPVLIGMLNEDDSLFVAGGSIIGVNHQNDTYILCKNELEFISKDLDKRNYERYPTSLTGEIKSQDENKREFIYLKDFSYLGMGAYSTGEFEIEDNVDISIYLSSNVAIFDGTIVRKRLNFGRNEYGIQILHRDKNSMFATQTQLTTIVQNEKNLIHRQLLNAKCDI
ncbi:PilZ domain-containing protein [Ruminiclostridium sufflavum DSM 19573]|uniref:PilZ domain-containing protein n=1 Tax=Ruminiclostridium sufflavum DSM 19573 TaxID=1121337 RepID=A0A318XJ31_9FIRM|nr:PilZ domain-containing protein [Ruminiclostridium sufflavum]PYG85853.1 PilZ domain-containing protein [Ruminiclostridium sufflavum DSM 19573]